MESLADVQGVEQMKLEVEIPDRLYSGLLHDPDQMDFVSRVVTSALYRSLDALSGARSRLQLEADIEALVDRFAEHHPETVRARFHCVNLHRFRDCNDTHGLLAGDAILRELADRLRQDYPGVPIYRIGGDKFVVSLGDQPTVPPVLPDGPTVKHATIAFVLQGPASWMCARELAHTVLLLIDECLLASTVEGCEITREVNASIL